MDEAVRLTFRMGPDGSELLSARRLQMRVPPTHSTQRDWFGMSVELIDDDGNTLYRRRLDESLARVEVPTGDANRPFARVDVTATERVVSVLVPILDGGRAVVVCEQKQPPVGTKSQRAKAEEPPQIERDELVAFDLAELEEGETD